MMWIGNVLLLQSHGRVRKHTGCAGNEGGSGVWDSASQLGRPPAMLT